MKRTHKSKEVLIPASKYPPIRVAVTDKHAVERAQMLPIIKQNVISPSQPHSKMHGR
jgi:hypothetical protein